MPKFIAVLERLQSVASEQELREIALEVSEPIRAKAELLAPRGKTLQYHKSIINRVVASKPGQVIVEIGPDRDKEHGYLGHMLEFKTNPHPYIKGGRKGTDKRKKIDRLKKKWGDAQPMHPGTKARPHLRPAWDSEVENTKEAIASKMQERIDATIRG